MGRIQIVRNHSGQNTNELESIVGRTPRSQNLQWAEHQWVRIHSGQNTLSQNPVDRTPKSQNPQWAGHLKVRLISGQDHKDKTTRSQNSQWTRHQGVRIHSVLDRTPKESESTVGRTPRSQNPQWAEHLEVRIHSGGRDTKESESNFSSSLLQNSVFGGSSLKFNNYSTEGLNSKFKNVTDYLLQV